jgi:hypothetical protein
MIKSTRGQLLPTRHPLSAGHATRTLAFLMYNPLLQPCQPVMVLPTRHPLRTGHAITQTLAHSTCNLLLHPCQSISLLVPTRHPLSTGHAIIQMLAHSMCNPLLQPCQPVFHHSLIKVLFHLSNLMVSLLLALSRQIILLICSHVSGRNLNTFV